MTDNPAHNATRIHLDPDPFEHFGIAQGYRIGNLVITSGQASIDEHANVVGAGNFDAQVRQTFENLKRVLEAANSSLAKIIKLNIYVTDMRYYPRLVELRTNYLGSARPADTAVEVSALALPGLMVEIEATALVEGRIIS
ncbi:MAG: RidA family protein [Nevskiaceae bacterium]|nr:MAG: RidA family protein [Nevskiaceae bacterium]TBR74263.1 MAG: RidA family protein [Nevskiaceae bacterium]